MDKIQENFIWQEKKAKIKHSALCNGYEMGGIKNVEDDFHDWKIIPLFLMGKQLGKNFKSHNNIDISNDILSKFLSFDQEIFIKWINSFTQNQLFHP